jgi:hypothetical protein
MRIPLARWVAPFGDPGINDRSHLPRAFRSVPRPSSPLSAKASTRCPYLRLSATPNGKDPCQISEVRYQRSEPIGATNFSFSEDTTGQRDAQPFRAVRRSPATVTQLASLRFSISNALAAPRQGMLAKANSRSSCRVRRLQPGGLQPGGLQPGGLQPGAGAFRGLRRKPLSARQGWRQLTMFAGANIGGGGDRARTDDPLLAKQVLSQLSYTPDGLHLGLRSSHRPDRRYAVRRKGNAAAALSAFAVCYANRCRRAACLRQAAVVGQGGFEPPTSRLSSARSNQLSY